MARRFKPLVALDVAGHEMSHGVTSATAGLDYSGDAGGLNEATSDVMGTMVEFYANNASDPGDYYIGEKIMKDGTYLRRMDNPSADGGSVNCWSTSRRQPRPALLLRRRQPPVLPARRGHRARKTIGGRAHSSTTCNGTTLTGIGRAAAAAIWYRALTTYWTSTTTYPQAANGMVQGGQGPVRRELDAVLRDGQRLEGRQRHPDGDLHHRRRRHGRNLFANPGFESGATSWTSTRA